MFVRSWCWTNIIQISVWIWCISKNTHEQRSRPNCMPTLSFHLSMHKVMVDGQPHIIIVTLTTAPFICTFLWNFSSSIFVCFKREAWEGVDRIQYIHLLLSMSMVDVCIRDLGSDWLPGYQTCQALEVQRWADWLPALCVGCGQSDKKRGHKPGSLDADKLIVSPEPGSGDASLCPRGHCIERKKVATHACKRAIKQHLLGDWMQWPNQTKACCMRWASLLPARRSRASLA